MIGYARFKLSKLQVVDTGRVTKVTGINFFSLMKDIGFHWETSVLEKYMFRRLNGYSFEVPNFFTLDLLYMMETLRDTGGIRTPKRTLIAMINLLKTRTWLSKIEVGVRPVVDMDRIKGLFPFEYKEFQTKFIEHYGKTVPAYNLKGYMLDAGAGTGKTATNLALAEALGVDKVIIIALKNSIDEVWRHTIDDLMIGNKQKAWVSGDNLPVDPTLKHFVVHYEYLGKFLDELKGYRSHFKNTLVVVDESHNFNRPESQRTEQLVELCQLPGVKYVNFASGTPIMALGHECIPFLRIVDPYFDQRTEERFRKIYGRTAKKANEILRNRIGHLKYHVPKQDVVKVEVTEQDYKVKLKDGNRFTLPEVSRLMSEYVLQRKKYYQENREVYIKDYEDSIRFYRDTLKTPSEKNSLQVYLGDIDTISKGYDPRTMREISMSCNRFERTQIIPALPSNMKQKFRDAKSVVKYPDLKVMGEALGNILGKLRSECNKSMLHAIEFDKLINEATKKTLIFTSYVDVVDETSRILKGMDYEPILVYGETNNELAKHVRTFYKDPDVNPMIATLQSLSTAVPITCANNVIYLNQPFREAIKVQSVSRVARLGQDSPVTVWNVLLDTGDVPNLSTRSNDIMEWSREQVAQIIGNKNLDPETLSFEHDLVDVYEVPMDDTLDSVPHLKQDVLNPILLYRTITTGNAGHIYTDSKEDAILYALRDLVGENVIYDPTTDTYKGTECLTNLSKDVEIVLDMIRPKEESGWYFYENHQGIPGALRMETTTQSVDFDSGLVSKRIVKISSLNLQKV